MGKKPKGARLRAKKRADALALEMLEEKAERVEMDVVEKQVNEELFVLDTSGDRSFKVEKPKSEKVKKTPMGNLDQRMMKELVEKHTPSKLRAMVKADQEKLRGKRKRQSRKFDLWESTTATPDLTLEDSAAAGIKRQHETRKSPKISTQPKNAVSVDISHTGGQSYCPDPVLHNEAIQEAVAVELRRNGAIEKRDAPITTGMSETTRALLLGDDDESEEEPMENNQEPSSMIKRPEKLTRAKRNKQKRLRAEQYEQDQQTRAKKFLKSVGDLPRIKKVLKTEEKQLVEKKTRIEQAKEAKASVPKGSKVFQRLSVADPIHAPTLPVALPEKEPTSLRTIIPKGSLVEDRMESFVDRNMTSKKKTGKKRVRQGRTRKMRVRGKGHDVAKGLQFALLG